MRIAVIGGGPGGLYFSALAKQLDPSHEITVWERNAAGDTFGFGVVFSDETLGGIEHADRAVFDQMQREFARWDDIDVHFRDRVLTSGGHGFAAMSRKRLLEILQARCLELGVTIHFRTQAPDVAELSREHDLVVACDGLNSVIRSRYSDVFGASLDARHCKYMWLGTDKVFDAFKFYIRETPHGVMQIHGYPYDRTGSTFIVEMNDDVWRRAGFDAFADRPFATGESDEKSAAVIAEIFADVLDGHEVLANNSQVDQLHHRAKPNLAARQRRPARRRRAHRPLLHRLGHQARDGGRARTGRLPARGRRRRERPRRLRGGAPAGRAVHAARGAGEPGVVREPRAVRRPGPGAVRVQHHDPQPTRHLRQPAAARPGVRRRGRRLVRRARAGARQRHRPGVPADVPAVAIAWARTGQPSGRLADGHVQGRSTVVPPTSTWCISAARRSAAPGW